MTTTACDDQFTPAPCMGMAQNCSWIEGRSTTCSCTASALAGEVKHTDTINTIVELGMARDEATARAEAAEARNKVLEEALRPFADAAAIRLVGGEDHWTAEKRIQGTDITFHITFGDLRRAAQALGGEHER